MLSASVFCGSVWKKRGRKDRWEREGIDTKNMGEALLGILVTLPSPSANLFVHITLLGPDAHSMVNQGSMITQHVFYGCAWLPGRLSRGNRY